MYSQGHRNEVANLVHRCQSAVAFLRSDPERVHRSKEAVHKGTQSEDKDRNSKEKADLRAAKSRAQLRKARMEPKEPVLLSALTCHVSVCQYQFSALVSIHRYQFKALYHAGVKE